MSCINCCIFTGRLVKEPDFRTTTTDKSVCNFSIAVESGWGDNKKTFYPDFVAWNGQADFASKLSKGTMVAVYAKFTQREYEDKQGTKRKAVEFVVEEIQAMEPKRNGG